MVVLLFLLWPLLQTSTIVSATSIVTPAVATNIVVVVAVVVDGSSVTVQAAVVATFFNSDAFSFKNLSKRISFLTPCVS